MDDGQGGDFTTVTGYDAADLSTTHTATGLTKGFSYGFKYACKNENGWSEFSDITYISAADVPAKPDTPTLVSASDSDINLQFYVPEDNGGSPITEYALYINAGDGSDPTTEITNYDGTSMTYTVGGTAESLTVGKIYKFKITATNAVGNSEDSEVLEVSLVDPPAAPSAPTAMTALTSQSQIAIEWT